MYRMIYADKLTAHASMPRPYVSFCPSRRRAMGASTRAYHYTTAEAYYHWGVSR